MNKKLIKCDRLVKNLPLKFYLVSTLTLIFPNSIIMSSVNIPVIINKYFQTKEILKIKVISQ